MMARLYANENFPLPVVADLVERGHDVLTSLDANRAGGAVPDEEVMRFSIAERRALLTINRRHFIRLLPLFPEHHRLILCKFDADFRRQAAAIHDAIADRVELPNLVLRINRPA